ncbi:hypothetical protein HMEPL2_07110 [Vreelandella aquamarina]|uniref:Uncharacterized protein n=1 Tax=Vreelandella aquamarina TaxID=77097 RepID=A0A6F8XAD9_9GAMM|nr:hypothetical protein HMEPL2_07110 [Halomonas meridiana]
MSTSTDGFEDDPEPAWPAKAITFPHQNCPALTYQLWSETFGIPANLPPRAFLVPMALRI